ncbi:MAG: hypothetical protein ACRD5H_11455, partial [Nitrososphaerales archaeon]
MPGSLLQHGEIRQLMSSDGSFLINYIWHGNFEEAPRKFITSLGPIGHVTDLGRVLGTKNKPPCPVAGRSQSATEVLAYLSQSERYHPTRCHKDTLSRSCDLYEQLQEKRIRGFSFALVSNPEFVFQIRKEFGLRFAMLFDLELFYPSRVAIQLLTNTDTWRGRVIANHLANAIGWAVGKEISIEHKTSWIIVVMQSDLVKVGPSCVRGHFRDWHRLLLELILEIAANAGVKAIAMVPCSEIMKAAKYPPRVVPTSWSRIY